MKALETREDLQNLIEYRAFLRERLKVLPATDEPFFVSKLKIKFDEGGKPWEGHAFLAGTKCLPSVGKLRKAGVSFREGTCTLQGKVLHVEGIDPGLVKKVQKTLLKLKLGYSTELADGNGAQVPGAPPGVPVSPIAPGGPAPSGSVDPASTAKLARLKQAIDALVPRVVAARPPVADRIRALRAEIDTREQAGDPSGALRIGKQLVEAMKKVLSTRPAEDPAAAAAASTGKAELVRLKRSVVPRVRPALQRAPSRAAAMAALLKQAQRLEQSGDLTAAKAAYEQLAEELARIEAGQPDAGPPESGNAAKLERLEAELKALLQPVLDTEPDDAAELARLAEQAAAAKQAGDVEGAVEKFEEAIARLKAAQASSEKLPDLTNWANYRQFMKTRLKQLPPEGGPFFITRKQLEFSIEGASWKGFAVLVGKKCLETVRELKGKGIAFRELTCSRAGKTLQAQGLPAKLAKEALKTFKKLKLGYTVESVGDAVFDAADVAEARERVRGLLEEVEASVAARTPAFPEHTRRSAGLRQRFGAIDVTQDPAAVHQALEVLEAELVAFRTLLGQGDDALREDVRKRREEELAQDLARRQAQEAQERLDALTAREQAKKATDQELVGRLPGNVLDVTRVQRILDGHRAAVPAETVAFFGKERMDDVLAELARIQDDAKRAAAAKAMADARAAAAARRDELVRALFEAGPGGRLGARSADDLLAATGNNQNAVDTYFKAVQLSSRMTDHIPEEYNLQPAKFDDRLRTLALTDPAEKQRLKDEVVAELAAEQGGERAAFEEVIEKHSGRSLDRADSYFDPLMTPPSADEAQRLQAAIQAALTRAHRIRDLGGTSAEAEKQFGGIPRTWWPAEFVLELQAWRKVERAMQEEALSKYVVDAPPPEEDEDGLWTDAKSVMDHVDEQFAVVTDWLTNDTIGDEYPVEGDTGPMAIVQDGVDELKRLYEEGTALVGFLKGARQNGFKEEAQKRIKATEATDVIDRINDQVQRINGAFDIASNVSSEAKEKFKKVMPGLAIVTGSLNLIKAIVKHTKELGLKVSTGKLMERAELERTQGRRSDAGAFEHAMRNEQRGRQRQMDEQRLEMLKAGVEITEGALEVSGVGAPAAVGVKIVGNAIEYGGKIYFANVDFNAARKAKKTLKEAQAGNPVARLQVFEDCATYAKMYVALLVLEDDPLAVEFIVQRGFEARDLNKPDVSALILRKFMMGSAGQVDERTTTDSRGRANADALLGHTPGKIADKIAEVRARPKGSVPYKRDWKHKSQWELISAAAWQEAQKAAEQHGGLALVKSDVPSTLAECEKALRAWGARALTADGVREAIDNAPQERRDAAQVKDLVAKLSKASNALYSYTPMHCGFGDEDTPGPHAGMTRYVSSMTKVVATAMNRLDQKLADSTWLVGSAARDDRWGTTTTWSSDVAELDPARWKRNWQEGQQKAWLDEREPGVEKLLQAVQASRSAEAAAAGADPQAQRKARAKYLASLDQLQKGLKDYWRACGHDGMRRYLDALTEATGKELIRLDLALNPDATSSVPGATVFPCPNKVFSSTAWAAAHRDAVSKGVIDPKEPGLTKLLKSYEDAQAKLEQLARGNEKEELRKQRRVARVVLKDLYLTAGGYCSKLGAPGMREYVNWLVTEAVARSKQLGQEEASVTFSPVTGFGRQAWEQSYVRAIQAGAVPPARDRSKALAKALEETDKAFAAFEAEGNPAKKRRLASKVSKQSAKLLPAIDGMLRCEGYDENEPMRRLLSGYQAEAAKRAGDPRVQDVLNGVHATFRAPSWNGEQYSNRSWQTQKKLAVAAGILDDSATGLGKALDRSRKSLQKYNTARGDKERIIAARDADAVVALASGLKCQNAAFNGYMDKIEEYARNIRTQIGGSALHGFPSATFQYTDASWQAHKKLAVAASILPKSATGLGKLLKTSKRDYDAFLEAVEGTDAASYAPKTKIQLKVKALGSLEAVIATVDEILKTAGKDEAFKDYIQGCSVAARDMLDRVQMKTGGNFKAPAAFSLDPSAFSKVKEEAIKAKVLPKNLKTGMNAALKKAGRSHAAFLELSSNGTQGPQARRVVEQALADLEAVRAAIDTTETVVDDQWSRYVDGAHDHLDDLRRNLSAYDTGS